MKPNTAPTAILILLLVSLFAVAGCFHKKASAATAALPKANTEPSKTSIMGARDNTQAAQTNVRTGKNEAAKAGATAAIPPLDKADSQLTEALRQLDEAREHVAELAATIQVRDDAQTAALSAIQTRLDEAGKTIAKLMKKISDLENESLRKAKQVITGVAIVLLLASCGCFVAFFMAGFTAGLRVGSLAGAVGAFALTIAMQLTKIVLWSEIILGIGVVAALGYGAWHVWHHIPLAMRPLGWPHKADAPTVTDAPKT